MDRNTARTRRRCVFALGHACIALFLVFNALSIWAAQAALVADAHVNSARPTANSGAISNLNVGGGYTALLQFDLSMLPSGTTAAQVTRAVLVVFCNRVNAPGSVSVQAVNGAWGEYSVTFATLPALGTAAQTVAVSEAGTFMPVDVTGLVQGWVTTPAANNGIALTSSTANVQFDSKENDQTGHAAMLDITLAATGPTGPQGPQGPAGVPGPPGAAGPQGVPGVAGAQGPTGPAGATGPAGPQGVAGPVGLNFQGAYSAALSYNLGDGVLYGGAGYVSLAAGNRGNAPDLNPAKWSEFASGGAGPAGPQGAAGPQGPVGPAGPAGATGAVGPQGPAGAGMRYRGTWSSGVLYAVNDAVTFAGSTYLAQIANSAEQPTLYPVTWAVLAQAGAAGPSGPTGSAATVSVGTVATGAPGSLASVTNSGNSSAAVLNFTIPQGQPGTGGAAGASGTDVSAAAVYHAVSNSYLFYSVTSGNFSGGSDAAQVLTWVPNGCTATKLQVYSQQGQTITVALRQGSLGAMTDTPLVCTVTPNSACVVTGSVSVAAGTFIDFHALGANVTPSPVWTALDCH